ncbi:MAG: hypothetical protein V1886_01875 [archaeon]
MITEIINKIESKFYGKRTHNLEISMQNIPLPKDKRSIQALRKYIGSFVVTEKGYLIKGHDNEFSDKHAVLFSSELIPPRIHYKENLHSMEEMDTIVKNFLGMRLLQMSSAYEEQTEKRSCQAQASFA